MDSRSDSEGGKSMMKSAGAVLAGVAANFVAVPIDEVCHATGIFPPHGEDMSDGRFLLPFAYRSLLAVLGGFVTARVARRHNPMKHVKTLGVVGIVLSSVGAIGTWDLGHHWYPIMLIVISMPCTYLGGKLALHGSV